MFLLTFLLGMIEIFYLNCYENQEQQQILWKNPNK